MSALRRRIFGGNADSSESRTPSPALLADRITIDDTTHTRARSRSTGGGNPGGDGQTTHEAREGSQLSSLAKDAVLVPIEKLEQLNKHVKQKGSKRRNLRIFGLGGLFGILMAVFFVGGGSDAIGFDMLREMNLDSLVEVLPAALIRDAQALQRSERDAVSYDSFSVGLHAKTQGITAHHPVIMIPGVISTGLESWGTEPESRQYFRKRLWGSWTMMRALVMDKSNWKRQIMLDKDTGLDPPGVKLRSAQGFDATDFFITGYWIWNKILENLATIGYDPTNSFTAAYDWRLSYGNLEERDHYFTRLKAYIETTAQVSGKKAVLLSHSMGSQVLYYFFHWVEAEGHGNGGPDWVDTHVDSWINISGCMLGAVKGLTAVLSGEMKDTAQLNAFAVYGLEKFLSRHERAEIFRAMPGISSMLPIGGDAVWGTKEAAPDDPEGSLDRSYGHFITFRQEWSDSKYAKNLSVGEAIPYLFRNTENWYIDQVTNNYSHGVAHTRQEVEENQFYPSKWSNPLETRLPIAPNLKIYCFYGIGKATERAYFYKEDVDPLTKTNVTIDTAWTSNNADHGVIMAEGDGTVNLLSLGYMCNRGWRMKRYNPGGVQVKVYEMPHEPDRFSPRGGPNTGDHVDILGRSSLNDLILRVAGGKGDLIAENIVSNIKKYSAKVNIADDDEEDDVVVDS